MRLLLEDGLRIINIPIKIIINNETKIIKIDILNADIIEKEILNSNVSLNKSIKNYENTNDFSNLNSLKLTPAAIQMLIQKIIIKIMIKNCDKNYDKK